MHVVEQGSGTPIVLLHGFSVDHRMLLPLDPTIASAGSWHRYYFDLPGHGLSPIGEVASSDDMARVVADGIRNSVADQEFAVLGALYGGMLARRISHDLRDQVIGLAALAGVYVANHALRSVPNKTVLHTDASIAAVLGEATVDYSQLAVVQSRSNAQAFLKYVYPGLVAAGQQALGAISGNYAFSVEPEDASPAPFTSRTLILTARQDQVVGYDDGLARVEHYPRATFATLDAAGHNVILDKPALVSALVGDWPARVDAA